MDKKPLKILLAEDNPADAELMLRELRLAGFEVENERVETEAEFLSRLDPSVDIIVSDFAMPQFGGLRALELLTQSQLDIPFILVSGTIGEETAVAAMRDGASDYLLKDRLTRLGQAVEQALAARRSRDQRRQADEKLNQLRRQHSLILNSAGEGIYGADLEGKINFANPRAAKLLGYEVDELLGKPADAIVHRSRGGDVGESSAGENPIRDCMMHGVGKRVTNDAFSRKDGKSFRVDYVCAPLNDETGRCTGAIVTFNDVTDQFMAEARLKLQEQQYRLLFEINPSPMWVYNTKSLEILAVNEAAIAQYGYSREEFLSLNLKHLRPAEDIPESQTAREQSSSAAGSHYSGQFRYKKKDGSLLFVEVYSAPITWEATPARIVTAIDVTERKKSEERMSEQADIINRAHDAIVIRDFATHQVTFWNTGAERMYGWTVAEAIGREVGQLIYANSGEQREQAINIMLETGEYNGELKQVTKDGRELIAYVRATLVHNNDGKPRAVLTINTDVTEKKKLEGQVLRAQRLESIGTLASGVAHDLNNVLTPILMASEAVRRSIEDEQIEASMQLIEESARRGAAIVRQVLTFARGVEGDRVVIKPSHLLEEMADIARKTFPKLIAIETKYSEDLWSIQGDPTQLHQVLLNLSVNARDAMPTGGSLVLAAENFDLDENYAAMTPGANVGAHVMLRVSDTGSGMPRAMMDKIFDPFFTTKETGKGTGLGLSTALGIVRSHNGIISVYSEPRQGTTFKIFLPATKQTSEAQPVNTQTERLRGNGEVVLVVDDEPGVLRITELILKQNNYEVMTAPEAPEAIALVAQRPGDVQLVLTDLMLPHMDGVSLVRAMTKIKPDMRFIASTGQGEQTRASELHSLGVHHFLSKPYDSQKLLQTLHEALNTESK